MKLAYIFTRSIATLGPSLIASGITVNPFRTNLHGMSIFDLLHYNTNYAHFVVPGLPSR